MKLILILIATTIISCKVNGQMQKGHFTFGAGISLAIPTYNLHSSKTGGGIDALLQYSVSKNVGITADAGFTGLPGKGKFPSTAIVPIRLGIKYFPQSKFFLAAKGGLGIYTILKASANHFAFSASSGYMITSKIEASLFYDGYSNKKTSFGYLGLRAGYNF